MALPSSPPSTRRGADDFVFVLSAQRLPSSVRGLQVNQKLWVDGPYGSELGVESCENLALVAQGLGILGVLPIALHIADRKRRDLWSGEAILGRKMKEAELRMSETQLLEKETSSQPGDRARLTKLRDKITALGQKLGEKNTKPEPS